MIMYAVFQLIGALILLIIASFFIIQGLKRLAKRFKLTNFFVGMTLAAFATSLPEIINSIFSGLKNQGAVAFGNIIGANISNFTLVLGILGLFTPLVFVKKKLKVDAIFLVVSVLVLFLAINDGVLSPVEGLILVFIYVVYIVHLLQREHH